MGRVTVEDVKIGAGVVLVTLRASFDTFTFLYASVYCRKKTRLAKEAVENMTSVRRLSEASNGVAVSSAREDMVTTKRSQ